MAENCWIATPDISGWHTVFSCGEKGMELTEFALLGLGRNEKYCGNTGEFEVAMVILNGRCRISGNGFDFAQAGGRVDVFSGAPHTIYLPRRVAYEIESGDGVEIAVNCSPVTRDTARPTWITPEKTRSFSIGHDNFLRQATVIIDETFDSEHFYIGEGVIPAGNWSGYPPHRHDIDNPPMEIDMEETYFYRFDPPQGFGFQRIYTADGRINQAYAVQHNDTVAIKEGFHPLCCAPGYRMYYLWTMAGAVNRGLVSLKDPVHGWVK